MSLLSRFIARIPMPIIKYLQAIRIPPEKRRLVMAIVIGAIATLLSIIIGTALLNNGISGGQRVTATDNAPVIQRVIIPPEELFLPDEPDFVPGVLLDREQRSMWTADDAAPYWHDPLRSGEQEWRDRIERTLNEIMENVP